MSDLFFPQVKNKPQDGNAKFALILELSAEVNTSDAEFFKTGSCTAGGVYSPKKMKIAITGKATDISSSQNDTRQITCSGESITENVVALPSRMSFSVKILW
jgi:hypothetical protein